MKRRPAIPPTDSPGHSKETLKIIDKVLSEHSAAVQARIAANKTPLQFPSDILEVLDCQLGQRSGSLLSPERQKMYRMRQAGCCCRKRASTNTEAISSTSGGGSVWSPRRGAG
jgi:hypothetical protein